eukprot:1843773-Pyramimonas_sp.AAC.1
MVGPRPAASWGPLGALGGPSSCPLARPTHGSATPAASGSKNGCTLVSPLMQSATMLGSARARRATSGSGLWRC